MDVGLSMSPISRPQSQPKVGDPLSSGSGSAPSAQALTTDTTQLTQPASEANAQGQTQTGRDGDGKGERESLAEAVSSVEDFVQSINRDLDFAVDDSTGQVVVKVTDRSSGDVIRQIPSEEMVELASRLEEVRSLLFEVKA